VASVDHAGDVLVTCGNTAELFEQRPQDVSAMLDHLQGLPAEDALSGMASADVVLVGHSYGGYTGLVVAGARFAMAHLEAECEPEAESGLCSGFPENAERLREGFYDARIKVLVPIAAGDYNVLRDGIAAIEVPTLFMTANSDLNNPDEVDGDPIWAQLQRPTNRRVRFDRAGHFSFTSICSIIGPLGDDNGCSENMVAAEELHPVINQYVMAFVRLHLFGDESGRALIDGEVSLRDEVTVVLPETSP
jgi:predicted dienelactone hydrolase